MYQVPHTRQRVFCDFSSSRLRVQLVHADLFSVPSPASLCHVRSPRHILFPRYAGNRLEALPATVGDLSSLRTLRVSNNNLTALPKELGSLPLLEEIHVDGNSGLNKGETAELFRQKPELRIVWDEERTAR